jgi:6-phospho-beta-glucosidase
MEEGDAEILRKECVDYCTFSYYIYMSGCISADQNHEQAEGNLIGGVSNPYLKASDWE